MTNETEIPQDTKIQKIAIPENYKNDALNTVKLLVKGNQFDPEDIKLEAFEGEILHFQAENMLTIHKKITQKTVPGRLKGPVQLAGESAVHEAIDKSYLSLSGDLAVKRQIRDAILERDDQGFGISNEIVKLPFWKKEFVFFEPCQTCKTSGNVTCLPCHGKGTEICARCNGSGASSCTHCNGAAMIQGPNGNQIQCPICHGQGRTSCNMCNQTGKVECKTCRTKGTTTCPNCQGNAWNSHIYHLEVEARTAFDYPRNRLPDKVVAMIDQYGVKIREHATIEISQDKESSVNLDDEEKQKKLETLDKNKDLRLPILYEVKIPYGHIEYDIAGKSYYTFLFGKNGELSHVSPFLDDLTSQGVRKLEDAAEMRGDVNYNLAKAVEYRTVKEGLYFAMRFGSGKAQRALKSKNKLGLSNGAIKKIITLSDKALKNITKKPRIIGLGIASLLHVGAFSTYFLSPLRAMMTGHIPNISLHIVLDFLALAVSSYIGVLFIQGVALSEIKKIMRSIMPDMAKKSTPPKLGNILYLNICIALLVFFSILEFSRQTGYSAVMWYGPLFLQ